MASVRTSKGGEAVTHQIQSDWHDGDEGVFFRLPAATYHKAAGFSVSKSKHLSPPARLPVYLDLGIETTIDMILGTLIHGHVLEPDVPPPQIAIHPAMYPGMDGKTPKDKKWTRGANYCKAWEDAAEAEGKIVLSQEEADTITGCVESIANNVDPEMRKFLRPLFADCDTEVSFFKDATAQTGADENGRPIFRTILRKARVDCMPRGLNVVVDIKKVQKGCADPDVFQKSLYENDYYVQAASNLSIIADSGIEGYDCFTFVVVEAAPPFLVATYTLARGCNALRLGALEWERRLATYARCAHSDVWPGYSPTVIDLSRWAVTELEAR